MMMDEEGPRASKLVLTLGASTSCTDHDGHTPLHRACVIGHCACVAPLLDAGADVAMQDDHGATALDWARCCGQPAAVKLLSTTHRRRMPHEPEPSMPQRVADQVLDGQPLP